MIYQHESVSGNGFVMYLMIVDRLLLTSINLFIGNLVTCDFITNFLVPWLILCDDLFQNFVLGPFLCKVEAFFRGKTFFLQCWSYESHTPSVLTMQHSWLFSCLIYSSNVSVVFTSKQHQIIIFHALLEC